MTDIQKILTLNIDADVDVQLDIRKRSVSDYAIFILKQLEGFSRNAYSDGKYYSIGFGHNGPDVQKDQICSYGEAEAYLHQDLSKVEKAINSMVLVPLTGCQFDALCEFSYNIGTEAFRGSTLLSLLNQGDYIGASLELRKWKYKTVNGEKVVSNVLKKRRELTLKMFWDIV
jgi:lysozyme